MKEKINILLITNTKDITTDFVVKKLKEKGIFFYRFNTDEFGKDVSISFDLQKNEYFIVDNLLNVDINLLDIKAVYFRRPEVSIDCSDLSEGESNFIKSEYIYSLEGIYRVLDRAFWINNVYKIREAENKIYQLLLAKEIGFLIPNSCVTNIPLKAMQFYEDNFLCCIAKPIKSGLVEGREEEGVIFTSQIELTERNVNKVKRSPTFFQNLIPKKGDIRVTVIGDFIYSAFIHSQNNSDSLVDWRKSSAVLEHTVCDIGKEIADMCKELMSKLQITFGAIDFILDKNGELIFLEINPNGQWAWIEKRLGYEISNKIADILVEKSYN